MPFASAAPHQHVLRLPHAPLHGVADGVGRGAPPLWAHPAARGSAAHRVHGAHKAAGSAAVRDFDPGAAAVLSCRADRAHPGGGEAAQGDGEGQG